MRIPLLYLMRFLLGMLLAWFLGWFLVDLSGHAWHRLGGRDPVSPLHGFQHDTGEVDVLFLGTSATRNAIMPEILEYELAEALGRDFNIWNLGLPSSTPEIARIVVEDLFEEGKPDCLVLEASPFLWDGERGHDADLSIYSRWFSSPSSWSSAGRILRSRDIVDYLRNLSKDWEDLWSPCGLVRVEHLRAEKSALAPKGGLYRFEDLDQPVGGERVDRKEPEREARRVGNYSTPDAWKAEMVRILEACAERDIEVILLHHPFYEGLLPMFEDGSYAEFIAWMEATADEHDLPLLLLQDRFRMEVHHFRDYIHLSPRGSRYYTEQLAPLLTPLLR